MRTKEKKSHIDYISEKELPFGLLWFQFVYIFSFVWVVDRFQITSCILSSMFSWVYVLLEIQIRCHLNYSHLHAILARKDEETSSGSLIFLCRLLFFSCCSTSRWWQRIKWRWPKCNNRDGEHIYIHFRFKTIVCANRDWHETESEKRCRVTILFVLRWSCSWERIMMTKAIVLRNEHANLFFFVCACTD